MTSVLSRHPLWFYQNFQQFLERYDVTSVFPQKWCHAIVDIPTPKNTTPHPCLPHSARLVLAILLSAAVWHYFIGYNLFLPSRNNEAMMPSGGMSERKLLLIFFSTDNTRSSNIFWHKICSHCSFDVPDLPEIPPIAQSIFFPTDPWPRPKASWEFPF